MTTDFESPKTVSEKMLRLADLGSNRPPRIAVIVGRASHCFEAFLQIRGCLPPTVSCTYNSTQRRGVFKGTGRAITALFITAAPSGVETLQGVELGDYSLLNGGSYDLSEILTVAASRVRGEGST